MIEVVVGFAVVIAMIYYLIGLVKDLRAEVRRLHGRIDVLAMSLPSSDDDGFDSP